MTDFQYASEFLGPGYSHGCPLRNASERKARRRRTLSEEEDAEDFFIGLKT